MPVSVRRAVEAALLGLVLLPVSACRAGPSAFDRAASDTSAVGPEDTAHISTLPTIPDAPSVETLATAAGEADGQGTRDDRPRAQVARAREAPAHEGSAGEAAAEGGPARRAPHNEAPGDRAPVSRAAANSVEALGVDEGRSPPPAEEDSASPQRAEMSPLVAADASRGPDSIADSEQEADRLGRPEHVRGVYLNAWAAGSRLRSGALLDLAARTEVNTFVIDIKDASGYVSHRTQVPLADSIGATEEIRIRDLAGLLSRLDSAGVYPIARIVIVKDPLLTAARPDLAVQDTAGGVWLDGNGVAWLNPHSREVWDYHVALAREVAEMGFPEIQWDYVRFPDAPVEELERSVYPGAEGELKSEAIRAFLLYSREALAPLGVRVTADVFGVTTSATRDVGIGQVWELFIDAVDVALPMIYPSHYWEGSFGIEHPNAHPYEVVREALSAALERSAEVEGAGTTRPWLQDFSLGEPLYEAPEVRAQIQATYDSGIQEWILWNPASRYTEGALEPVDGFVEEPLLRLGNQRVPVGRRFEFLDSLKAAEAADTLPKADTVPVPDTGSVRDTVPVRDTLRVGPTGRRR